MICYYSPGFDLQPVPNSDVVNPWPIVLKAHQLLEMSMRCPPQPKLAEPLCLNLTLYTAQASLKEFEYVDGPRFTVCMTALALLLKPDVLDWKGMLLQVTVVMTRCILFSGLPPANRQTLRTNHKEDKVLLWRPLHSTHLITSFLV